MGQNCCNAKRIDENQLEHPILPDIQIKIHDHNEESSAQKNFEVSSHNGKSEPIDTVKEKMHLSQPPSPDDTIAQNNPILVEKVQKMEIEYEVLNEDDDKKSHKDVPDAFLADPLDQSLNLKEHVSERKEPDDHIIEKSARSIGGMLFGITSPSKDNLGDSHGLALDGRQSSLSLKDRKMTENSVGDSKSNPHQSQRQMSYLADTKDLFFRPFLQNLIDDSKNKIMLGYQEINNGNVDGGKQMLLENFHFVQVKTGQFHDDVITIIETIAKCDYILKNYDDAEMYIDRALDTRKNQEDLEKLSLRAYVLKIDILVAQKKIEKARSVAEQAFKVIGKYFQAKDLPYQEIVYKYGELEYYYGKIEPVQPFLNSVLPFLNKKAKVAYEIYLLKALILYRKLDTTQANIYYNSAIESAKSAYGEFTHQAYKACLEYGKFLMFVKDYSKASDNFEKCVEIGIKLGLGIQQETYYLGKIQEVTENYSVALELMEKTTEIEHEKHDNFLKNIIQNKIYLMNFIVKSVETEEINLEVENPNESESCDMVKLLKKVCQMQKEKIHKLTLKIKQEDDNRYPYTAVVILASALTEAKNLQELSLDFCNCLLVDNSAKMIAIGIENLSELKSLTLNFKFCRLSDVALREISVAVQRVPKIEQFDLNLCKNEITNKGALALLTSLLTKKLTKKITINYANTKVTAVINKNYLKLNKSRNKNNKIDLKIIIQQFHIFFLFIIYCSIQKKSFDFVVRVFSNFQFIMNFFCYF